MSSIDPVQFPPPLLALLLVLTGAACFSGPGSAPTEKTCEANCDRQSQAGCSATTATAIADCKQGCIIYRADYPDCVSPMNAVSGCVDSKVTYICDAKGNVVGAPVAVCSTLEYDCQACTGDVTACRN